MPSSGSGQRRSRSLGKRVPLMDPVQPLQFGVEGRWFPAGHTPATPQTPSEAFAAAAGRGYGERPTADGLDGGGLPPRDQHHQGAAPPCPYQPPLPEGQPPQREPSRSR